MQHSSLQGFHVSHRNRPGNKVSAEHQHGSFLWYRKRCMCLLTFRRETLSHLRLTYNKISPLFMWIMDTAFLTLWIQDHFSHFIHRLSAVTICLSWTCHIVKFVYSETQNYYQKQIYMWCMIITLSLLNKNARLLVYIYHFLINVKY